MAESFPSRSRAAAACQPPALPRSPRRGRRRRPAVVVAGLVWGADGAARRRRASRVAEGSAPDTSPPAIDVGGRATPPVDGAADDGRPRPSTTTADHDDDRAGPAPPSAAEPGAGARGRRQRRRDVRAVPRGRCSTRPASSTRPSTTRCRPAWPGPDFFDWPAHLRRAAAGGRPGHRRRDVRRQRRPGAGRRPTGRSSTATPSSTEDEWLPEYTRRAGEVMDLLAADGRTVIWVGIPNDDNPEVTARLEVQDEAVRAAVATRPDVRVRRHVGPVLQPQRRLGRVRRRPPRRPGQGRPRRRRLPPQRERRRDPRPRHRRRRHAPTSAPAAPTSEASRWSAVSRIDGRRGPERLSDASPPRGGGRSASARRATGRRVTSSHVYSKTSRPRSCSSLRRWASRARSAGELWPRRPETSITTPNGSNRKSTRANGRPVAPVDHLRRRPRQPGLAAPAPGSAARASSDRPSRRAGDRVPAHPIDRGPRSSLEAARPARSATTSPRRTALSIAASSRTVGHPRPGQVDDRAGRRQAPEAVDRDAVDALQRRRSCAPMNGMRRPRAWRSTVNSTASSHRRDRSRAAGRPPRGSPTSRSPRASSPTREPLLPVSRRSGDDVHAGRGPLEHAAPRQVVEPPAGRTERGELRRRRRRRAGALARRHDARRSSEAPMPALGVDGSRQMGTLDALCVSADALTPAEVADAKRQVRRGWRGPWSRGGGCGPGGRGSGWRRTAGSPSGSSG